MALQAQLQRFMDDLVLPSLGDWHRYADAGVYPLDIVEPLKARARALRLWNLFLPSLRDDQPGMRLSNIDYAPLAECMGRVPWAAEVFNCSAPASGNIELLQLFASPAQRERWLDPLLKGEIRSCFAMSEPDVGSSDPTQLQTSIARDGDEWVINGRKWFVTGAAHPLCRVVLIVGRSAGATAPQSDRHHGHSIVLVPMDTPGFEIERNIPVMDHRRSRATASWFFATSACRSITCWANPGPASRWHRRASGPGGFITPCAASANASWHSS